MSKLKYDTIEEAADASGIELNEQTRPFLATFVKKAGGSNAGEKRKLLFQEVEEMGVEGMDADKETMDSLKVRGCQFLYSQGQMEELEAFASRFNLTVDEETGAVHRVKAKVKPIEERNAGSKEGTVGWVTIQMLQNEDYADMPVTELVEHFTDFATELGYPELKPTTAPSIQWYINYCRKKGIEICQRKTANKAATAGGLGAELTLEKALEPRGFKKKKSEGEAGDDLVLDDESEENVA